MCKENYSYRSCIRIVSHGCQIFLSIFRATSVGVTGIFFKGGQLEDLLTKLRLSRILIHRHGTFRIKQYLFKDLQFLLIIFYIFPFFLILISFFLKFKNSLLRWSKFYDSNLLHFSRSIKLSKSELKKINIIIIYSL